MLLLVGILLICSVFAYENRCWSAGNGQEPKWWNEGERVDRGLFWYECRRGQLAPRGCFTEDGKRLSIGDTFNLGGYIARCQIGADDYLEFAYTDCVGPNGQRYKRGEVFTDKQNTYVNECAPDGPYLRMKTVGCVSHDKSQRLAIGERYDYKDYTYECSEKTNGTVQLCSVGCVHEGKRYKIGEQWPENDFIFYCKMNGGRCQKKCIGCMSNGRSLYDGDRYRRDNTVYQCEIRPDSYGQKPVGCVDTNGVDRVIGCRWYLTTPESKIEQTCEMMGDRASINTIGCIYRHNGYDTIFLNPGSYTVWAVPRVKGQIIGIACRQTGNKATLEVFDAQEVQSKTSGLKYDLPRGK